MAAQPSSKNAPGRKRKEKDLPTPGPFSEHQLWTREDFRILHQYYPTKGTEWVARKLGRTREAVKIKAGRIGLHFDGMRAWTKKELTYLCRNYHKQTFRELAANLDRPSESISGQVRQLRLKGKKDPNFPYRLQEKPAPQFWSREELQLLRRHYGSIPTAELAERLGRSASTVRIKAFHLGLTYRHVENPRRKKARGFRTVRTLEESLTPQQKNMILKEMERLGCKEIARRLDLPHSRVLSFAKLHGYNRGMAPKRWKPEEIAFLQRHYHTMLLKDISASLGRSIAATADMVERLALPRDQGFYTSGRRWSAEDERLMVELYPKLPITEVAARLGRSVSAVSQYAVSKRLRQRVGSYSPLRKVWTAKEDQLLRRLIGTMPQRAIANKLGRTASAVAHRIADLGLSQKSSNRTLKKKRDAESRDRRTRQGNE